MTERSVDRQTLDWVSSLVGSNASVRSVRRLTGGTTSAVHAVNVVSRGVVERLVLRRYMDANLAGLIDLEAEVLGALSTCDVPTPEFVGADATGLHTWGRPALVMSRLQGAINLRPRDPQHWVEQMARTLARVHTCDVAAPAYESWLQDQDLVVPNWTRTPKLWKRAPKLWKRALDIIAQGAPSRPDCFIHGDYQHFNLLWTRDRLTGVIDWPYACRGAPDRDVGHCRLNLTLLFSPELAESFREAWEAEVGRELEPWWDIASLVAYLPRWEPQDLEKQIAGRAVLQHSNMNERVEAVLAGAVKRNG